MADKMVVAFPTIGEGGLESERSGHFGHCDTFTLIEIDDGAVSDVRVVTNPPHVEGGCLGPVGLIASHGATAIVVAGMGARPLAGFNDAGITVYFENQTPLVSAVVTMLLDGQLEIMDGRSVCQH